MSHENLLLVVADQMCLREPFSTAFLNQATHIDPGQVKSIHISFRMQAVFQFTRSLHPNPPSDLSRVQVSQETFAE